MTHEDKEDDGDTDKHKDVERAIIDVAGEHGGKNPDEAVAYLAHLKKTGRYQADVY